MESNTTELTSELAVFICILAIALIGITTTVLSSTWRVFQNQFMKLPVLERKGTIRLALLTIVLSLIYVAPVVFVGAAWPHMVNRVLTFSMTISLLLIMLCMFFRKIRKRYIGKADANTTLYLCSCILFCISIVLSLFGFIDVVNTALHVEILSWAKEEITWGKWFLWGGLGFFFFGFLFSGLAYIIDGRNFIKRLTKNM